MLFIPEIAKLNFQHHYSSLQCHMIHQKSFYADLVLKKDEEFENPINERIIQSS